MEESGVRLIVENAGSYFSALAKASDATDDLNKAAQQAAKGVNDFGDAANKIKLQQLNNQLADQKNRLTALSAELEKQGNAYDFTSKKALSTAAAYQRVEKQAQLTQAKIALLNQKMNQGDGGKPMAALPDLKTEKQESAIKGLIGSIGGLAGAYVSLGAVADFAFQGLTLGAELEQSKFAIQTLSGSVEKGNAIYAEAIAFGQKYGYTQQEMASAAAQAASIFAKTNQSTEKNLEVLGRLAALNPAEGFEGAVVAFKELASGDITSIADRFNIARGEANAMKDAIAAGADPVKVLDDALAKMNVTSDVLSNRMKGTNGALLDVKLAFEDSKLAAGEFLTAIGAPEMLENFATGLKFVTDKVREYIGLMQQAQGINPATGEKQATATTGLNAANYGQYQQENQAFIASQQQAEMAVERRNASLGVLGSFLTVVGGAQKLFADDTINGTIADRALTESEFALAQSFLQRGVAQQDAASKAIQLNQATTATDNALGALIGTEAVTAQQSKALQDEIIALAMAHPEYTDQIFNTINAELEQGTTSEGLSSAIQQLSDDIAYNEIENTRLESAALLTAQATDVHTASVYELSAAQLEDTNKKIEAAAAAERLAQWEQDLAFAVDASQGSALDAAGAALYLSQAYGIEYTQALKLIQATNALNEARAGRQGQLSGRGVADALAGAIDYNIGRREGRITAPYEKPERAKKAGAGKKAGKSDEVKAAEKREKELAKIEKKIVDEKAKYDKKKEDLDRAHLQKLMQINMDYYKKALEAEKKFNTDKFNVRNGFKGSILDIDKDLWDAARAEEVGYWNESQAIAQAGDAKRAEAFYQAAQEYAAMKAQHAQELRDLDAQIAGSTDEAEQAELAERKRRLEEYYTEQELLAKEGLDKLRTGENELVKERDDAIAEENSRYIEANNELDQNYKDTVAELVESSGELQDAVVGMVSALIPSFASLAQAARDAANAAGSVPDATTMPVESRAGGGNVQRNRAYLVGDKPGGKPAPWSEIFVPNQSGTIIPRQQTQRLLESRPRSLPASPQQQLHRQESRAIAMNTTNNYNLTVQTNQSPRVVTQSYAQLEALSK